MAVTPPSPASDGPPVRSSTEDAKYRKELISLEQQSQKAFDTTIVTLAGGALGLSFAFLKDILGGRLPRRPSLILTAWLLWVAALGIVLASHYTSVLSMRRAIRRLDSGHLDRDSHYAGGAFEIVTAILNGLALAAFVVGLVLAGFFLNLNMGS